jgi:putative endonuclease
MAARSSETVLKRLQVFGRLSDASRQWRERFTLHPTQALGRQGEDLAHRYLRGRGFHILARRFRLPDASGEVDIIARQRDIIVFVEVKARRSAEYGSPERAVDPEKQRKLIRVARSYILKAGADWSQVRFDIVSVVLSKPPVIAHYEDAFFPSRTI